MTIESAYNASPFADSAAEETHVKSIPYLLGVLLIVVAAIYLLVPADSLPSFFPGHEAGLARIRLKHGLIASVAGIVLFAIGWFGGRRS